MRTQFMGVGYFGKSPNVIAQTRKNLYLDMQAQDDKTRVSAHPTPGLEAFDDLGAAPARGIYSFGDNMYVVHNQTLWQINNAAVATNVGTLDTSSGNVSIIDNGVQIMIVDGLFGYIYVPSTDTFTKITDGDFTTSPQTVTFNGSYFIVTEDGTDQFYISANSDGLSWDATDFATAESHPDQLVRVEENNGDIVLFGENTSEFWGNTGDLDFPYTRLAGTEMQWGLAARWSVAKFDDGLMFLGKSRQGEVKVMYLNGYQPIPASHSDIERIFNSGANSNATAFSYMIDGHSMYQINFPTLNRSFLFDGTSKVWSEVTSSGGRHLGQFGTHFIDNTYVTSYTDGNIYRLKGGVYTDAGATIIRELTGRHFETNMDYFTVQRFILDIEAGVGLATGQGSDPQVMLQYSTDNGHTWSEELWTTMGKIGEYENYAEWWRLGRGKDFLFRVRVSDPVKFVIAGAGLKVQ